MLSFAPGARVVVRDEEWLVRRVDPSSDGGYLLNCDGVSDLVRGRSSLFLTKLEGEEHITVLDPAKTELVADPSSHFNSTFLYLEAKLRQSTPNDDRTLMLLSATPHDGSARSFASLMGLLDPTAISDPDDYTPGDFQDKGLVIRRFKKDIRDQVAEEFQERITEQLRQDASPEEEAAYEALLAIPFTQKGRRQGGRHQELQRVGMQKSIFSSPAAALKSTRQRIRLLEGTDDGPNPEESAEITALQVFAEALEKIDAASFSKFQRLVTQLRDATYGWKPSDPADRLVVFSERIETLEWLLATLPATLGMKVDQFQILHGGMSDTEQQDIVERFGRKDDAMRVLLCSDVASEGLNLHYFCHRLVHFDLPWSLMVFQQRNGRVDRYGQRHQPRITYLFTETGVERIKGDLRILEILQTKDEQANKNLGDPASFLHVYDPDKEAAKVEEAMAAHVAPEAFERELDENAARAEEPPTDDDDDAGEWLMSLFASGDTENQKEPQPPSTTFIDEPPSLFGDDRSDIRTDLATFLAAFPEDSPEWPAILSAIKNTVGGNLRPAALRTAVLTFFQVS